MIDNIKPVDEPENQAYDSADIICPDCGKNDVITELVEHTFEYGSGEKAVLLSAEIPARTCQACGFSFLDSEADDACHSAICLHLQVMPPVQIKALRSLYRMSQTEFAEVTRLGVATLSRWERGTVVQNPAYDNFLYLLGFSDNIRRLQGRAYSIRGFQMSLPDNQVQYKLHTLKTTEELLERKETFKLQYS